MELHTLAPKTRKRLLCAAAIAVAIATHIATIVAVHGMAVIYHMGDGPDITNTFAKVDSNTHPEREKQVEKHNEQLRQVFAHFVTPTESTLQPHAPSLDMAVPESPQITTTTTSVSTLVDAPTETLSPATSPNVVVPLDNTDYAEDLLAATSIIPGAPPESFAFHRDATKTVMPGTSPTATQATAGQETLPASGAPLPSADSPLATVASSNDFTIETAFCPAPDGGYLFRLQLVPKQTVSFKRIKQNLFFLIDRSYSIDPERYELSKAAVINAIKALHTGDTFNILVFDSSITRMADDAVAWSTASVEAAEAFLAEQAHGGFYAGTELYSSLDKIIPEAVADNEVNTAILLSDGDTSLTRDDQRNTISLWSRNNSGKVSLFCVAADKSNNVPLLDVLSASNKGCLIYKPSIAELEEGLLELIDQIKNPIGKDIVITAIVPDNTVQLTTFPQKGRLADLYENRPYIIYGHINKLTNFYLFLQGKYYDHRFDIKQLVAFEEAQQAEPAQLQRLWAMHNAYACYDQYLSDGKPIHINEAKRLLAPYDIPIAFR